MNSRITTSGFEKAFIESWDGWDMLDTTSFIFYNSTLTNALGIPTDKPYDVTIDLYRMEIEVSTPEDDTSICTRKIVLSLAE